MYNVGDIVLVRCRFISNAPKIHVKLIEREISEEYEGNYEKFPGYSGWYGVLVRKKDCDVLRKKWCIPFNFPDDVETFVFDSEIVKRINKT